MSEPRTQDMISGRLSLWQHPRGYRFGLDALLLATDLPELKQPHRAHVLELGAGQGAVALSIAARQAFASVRAVERNPSMLALLGDNIAHNQACFGETIVTLIACDLREHRAHLQPHSADLIVCNPPYFPLGHRRESDDEERADAHHERHGDLEDFIRAATYLLTHRGWFKLILPPWRLPALCATLMSDLKLLSLRFVHAEPHQPAYLMEAVMRRGGGPDLVIREPLYVRGDDGLYTEEVARRVAAAALATLPHNETIAQVRAASDRKRGL